ncbi:MAG: phosphoribosylformylglycinamidine synthase subunit PurL [Fimbriimonadaceae bacterium]|nr:phosphoribosylformylglycinamidine synthase subunit PurL [Fimbriimonadaceae bacterium]
MAAITPDVYLSMGLRSSEYDLLLKRLGREPTLTEVGMFAVMWSEHCGYKYSRPVLAFFKKYKEAMEGSGLENAGVVEIGDGLGVTMKVESHNHPSAVEPYQGAATGVGGIIRDILTMGARPIAGLNSLRFGPIRDGEDDPAVVRRNRFLFEGVVAGIAGYGNCVGVPTVGGEVFFHARFSGNPLVNAMCVGLLECDKVTTAAASGVGNPVIYLGSATGKDGIHGATFASDSLGEDNEAKRPNVQIGDPFAEKQVIEATLEALGTGAIVAIQDMGAAGLTCSTTEMASKGSVGMDVDLDLVPMRERDMTAYELMLSESQERMLAVAHLGREQEVLDVFHKWGLPAVVIGRVTDDGLVTIRRHGKIEAQVNPKVLTDECPVYETPWEEPAYFNVARSFDIGKVPVADPQESLLRLLACPNIASKRWVYRQYDSEVQTQTSVGCGAADAAVLAPRGTLKGLALAIDGNGLKTYLDPFVGGQLAVVEAARNVACTGARPVAATDGLNFGNPEKPHVFWQFHEAVRGIAEACETMETPVVSGNVSFYNQSDLGEVLPTPMIGMLGVLESAERRVGMGPLTDGALLMLVSTPLNVVPQSGLGASAYLAEIHGIENGVPVPPNVPAEHRLCRFLEKTIGDGWVEAAHDVSDGGLAVCLSEMAMASGGGLNVSLDSGDRLDAALFGEFPGWVVVVVPPARAVETAQLAERMALSATLIGAFDAGSANLTIACGDATIRVPVSSLRERYEHAIPAAMHVEA